MAKHECEYAGGICRYCGGEEAESAYYWTEEADEIAQLAAKADAIEVAGCCDTGGDIERCDDQEADLYSVYFHFTPEWPGDPMQLMGALCIADRDTLADALAYANELASTYNLPVNNFAS